jgi:hypothetical protein
MEQLGSAWVRISAYWNSIAPTNPPPGFNAANPGDPHYYWSGLDHAVRDAEASNQHVLLMLEAPPSWALAPGAPRSAAPHTWRPNPIPFGAFAHAVAQRYSGQFPDPSQPGRALPRISDFQVWNEPNMPFNLTPQWTRRGNRWLPASPTIYRGLLNAGYASIKSVQPRAEVLAAGLAPYGDPPGISRMRPVQFLRELLCLRGAGLHRERCPNPAHFDAIDVHPYALTPTIHAFNQDDVSVPDLGRLSRVLRAAERTGRALPHGRKATWVTEIGWDSSPPDPHAISTVQQARYLSLALYEAWRQGVSHVFWYEVRDPGGRPSSFAGAGLFFSGGQAKPATVAFRFPFVAIRGAGAITTLWGRAPRAGLVSVEVARHGRWRRLLRLATTSGGMFYLRRRLGSRLTLRARIGTTASYPWAA